VSDPVGALNPGLKLQGVTVFAASGNNGSSSQMAAPACVSNAVSVGAVHDSELPCRITVTIVRTL
jgi:hypothetical protein